MKGAVDEALSHCNKCGFCLPTCPTYQVSLLESLSPRGRLALMQGLRNGEVEATGDVRRALDLCLECRACEVACPSGVGFGHAIEETRSAQGMTRAGLEWLWPLVRNRARFRRRVALGAALERAGLMGPALAVGRRLGLVPPGPMVASLLRNLPGARRFRALERMAEPAPRATHAFFLGCVGDALFPHVNADAITLLRAAGARVALPGGQTCCGALFAHAGRHEEARACLAQNVEAFEGVPGPVVNVAGGCGAFLREAESAFGPQDPMRPRARRLAQRVVDLSEALVALAPLRYRGRGRRVALQDSCHLANVARVTAAPRALLDAVEGDERVELADAGACCGSAGSFSFSEPDMSRSVLERKLTFVRQSGVDTLLVENPGCELQLRWGVEQAGVGVEVLPVATYLRQALIQSAEARAGAEGTPCESG